MQAADRFFPSFRFSLARPQKLVPFLHKQSKLRLRYRVTLFISLGPASSFFPIFSHTSDVAAAPLQPIGVRLLCRACQQHSKRPVIKGTASVFYQSQQSQSFFNLLRVPPTQIKLQINKHSVFIFVFVLFLIVQSFLPCHIAVRQ